MEFTVEKCRKILGDAAIEMTDKEVEELRDFYIAFSDYIIDSRVEKLKLQNKEDQHEKQTPVL